MYDTGKILAGLFIFIGFLGFPIWYNTAGGKTPQMPELEKPQGDKCVKSTEYMRANHMALLYDWREEVVRDSNREFKLPDGKECKLPDGRVAEKSLTETCLACHNYTQFCHKCHEYEGVATPYCWDCHTDPRAKEVE